MFPIPQSKEDRGVSSLLCANTHYLPEINTSIIKIYQKQYTSAVTYFYFGVWKCIKYRLQRAWILYNFPKVNPDPLIHKGYSITPIPSGNTALPFPREEFSPGKRWQVKIPRRVQQDLATPYSSLYKINAN